MADDMEQDRKTQLLNHITNVFILKRLLKRSQDEFPNGLSEYLEKINQFSDVFEKDENQFIFAIEKALDNVFSNTDSNKAKAFLTENINPDTCSGRAIKKILENKQNINDLINAKNSSEIAEILPKLDKEYPTVKDAILKSFVRAKDAASTEMLLPYIDMEDEKSRIAAYALFLHSNDSKQIDMIMPILDIKPASDEVNISIKSGKFSLDYNEIPHLLHNDYWFEKAYCLQSDNTQYLVEKVSTEAAVDKLVELGAKIQESDILPMVERGLFHDEVERKVEHPDANGNITIETKYGNTQVPVYDAKRAYSEYYQKLFEHRPEDMSVEDVYKAIEFLDYGKHGDIDHCVHTLCHCYEHGFMEDKDNRVKGNIVLDKIARLCEEGQEFNNDSRCFAGYWQSVQWYPEAAKDFRKVLEKHPHVSLCRKYLGYMNGEKEKDLNETRKEYIQNPNMLYVDTTMVDIDGTLLLDNGNLNISLLKKLKEQDYAIYTGGEPEKQRKILLKACENAEISHRNNEETSVLISDFKSKLSNGCPIYSKEAFTEENICLAGKVYDDTIPEKQGIKSLTSYGDPDYTLWQQVPADRKISAAQVVTYHETKVATAKYLAKVKGKLHAGDTNNGQAEKTEVLREIAKDNVSPEKGVTKPKRSAEDKKVLGAAINAVLQKTND
ncbi:MAG: hypothetical protein E7004_05460 [Alphaproteobacteria bacterium]|nr:hypothetical protein [Alphaproteobacteria bacterium]